MAYKTMNADQLYAVYRRWVDCQSKSRIALALDLDRKTIRKYLKKFSAAGLNREKGVQEKNSIITVLLEAVRGNERAGSAGHALDRFAEEIKGLVGDSKEPVKPKSAYQILKGRHGISVSYSSFKRYVKKKRFLIAKRPPPLRIELPAGIQTQVDYGDVGLLFDKEEGRNRKVYAFCGVLACSRLPYVEFVFSQDQRSFSESVINMGEHFGGFTQTVAIDNLKAGVLRPDVYDPTFNRVLEEVAEYYGFFIDPCRVRKSTDKGKVERFIQPARELFRILKHLHPTADIHELNEYARKWCLEEYGQREHGTTRQKPWEVFKTTEAATLKALPESRFEVPVWKQAKVHIDRFVQFEKKRYGLPDEYIGQTAWIRKSPRRNMVQIFVNSRLIRQFTIPRTGRTYHPDDFPATFREMMEGAAPKYILEQAKQISSLCGAYILDVLSPHAYLNLRRAQGIMEVLKKHRWDRHFTTAVAEAKRAKVHLPSKLKRLMEDEVRQVHLDESPLISSELGEAMIRPAAYYTN